MARGDREEGTDIELEAINPILPFGIGGKRERERAWRNKALHGNFNLVGANGRKGDKESSETNIKSRNRCDRVSQSVPNSLI